MYPMPTYKAEKYQSTTIYGRIPIEYIPCENLAVDLKKCQWELYTMNSYLLQLVKRQIFVHAIPMQNRQSEQSQMRYYIVYVV